MHHRRSLDSGRDGDDPESRQELPPDQRSGISVAWSNRLAGSVGCGRRNHVMKGVSAC